MDEKASREIGIEVVEGEIGLVIDYQPGMANALDVLQGAMNLIAALDGLDKALLSSVDTELEPVSILNDVQHSSLKILLARAVKRIPDEVLASGEWKQWVGMLLVKGKYLLLQHLESDAPQVENALAQLEAHYKTAPGNLVGYTPPSVAQVLPAMHGVMRARASLRNEQVLVQMEEGDVCIAPVADQSPLAPEAMDEPAHTVTNRGEELFKVKSTDMLGRAQWTVLRDGRQVKVAILHESWLAQYQQRQFQVAPGDSLHARYEETIHYDNQHNELERTLAIVEVLAVVSPPKQMALV